MRSLERRFKNLETKNPLWSSYVCFAQAIINQKFNSQAISRWFNKLVDKSDYDRRDKKSILAHLDQLTKHPEHDKK